MRSSDSSVRAVPASFVETVSAEPRPLWDTLTGKLPSHRRHIVVPGQRLASGGTPITEVWFPRDAIVLIARQTPLDPLPLTVALVGGEGLIGGAALLEVDQWSHDSIVVSGGEVIAVPVAELTAAVAANPALRRQLLRVVHNQFLQLAQSVVANLGHSLERRLSRWLIMLDDRTVGDTIAVTHDQLAQLLNVRRASVTDALHVLEGEQLIRSLRGRVRVRDRAALEARAGQSYGLSEHDYRASVGPFGKDSAGQQ